jgi:hypothetical protein
VCCMSVCVKGFVTFVVVVVVVIVVVVS